MLGTLPTFVAIFGLVFLTFMLSYTTIRSKSNQLAAAMERLKTLAEERITLAKALLSIGDLKFLEWKEIEDAQGLLRHQDQVISKVDELAVAEGLDEKGIEAFKKHLSDTQEAMDEYHQIAHQYNSLVTRKPNSFVGQIMGYKAV
ncbi:MAG TPA: hypothetical protein DCE41_36115 [Cytophagales bacterium]|nr:hypothetical protein [Cytophagales bacterium]HAA18756.1 hypothetical protein [Cytophagales bacterium]HAP63152.1 hypothetical protein [Cytophagales bacterium]